MDESFDFLLDKEFPVWVENNSKHFFSFLAGFTDAEGNIGIYNKMARFSLGNYDSKLLEKIRANLITFGISCNKLIYDKRKGKKNSQGYEYRNNYCSLRIDRKLELAKLFDKIALYIKHKNKIKDLNIARNNVNKRLNRQK